MTRSSSFTIAYLYLVALIACVSVSSAVPEDEKVPRSKRTYRKRTSVGHGASGLFPQSRALYDDTGKDCDECPFDVFWYYEEGSGDGFFRREFHNPPAHCVLAAIRDDESRAGAGYAIPKGKVAITQGYFPIDDYLKYCEFNDPKSDEGVVRNCDDYHYTEFFVNYEDSHVPDDTDCWVNATFPLPAGLLNVAIGSDGLLRPVSQVETDTYDGAVYECCPRHEEVCNVVPRDDP